MSSSTSSLRSRIWPSRATTRSVIGLGGVVVDGGGAADGSDGGGHQPGMLLSGRRRRSGLPAGAAGPAGRASARRPRPGRGPRRG